MSEPEKHKASLTKAIGFGVVLLLVISVLGFLFISGSPPKPYDHKKNECINNLRLIDGAKQTWALEHDKTNSDIPTWADIQPYLGRSTNDNVMLKCPSGGLYSLGAVSNTPTCSIPGHVLP